MSVIITKNSINTKGSLTNNMSSSGPQTYCVKATDTFQEQLSAETHTGRNKLSEWNCSC